MDVVSITEVESLLNHWIIKMYWRLMPWKAVVCALIGVLFHRSPKRKPRTRRRRRHLTSFGKISRLRCSLIVSRRKKEMVQEAFDKSNPGHKIVVESVSDVANLQMVKHDGARHTYQIVGTWTALKDAEEMQAASDSTFVFDITVGENGWEEFYLLQDGDWERKICPSTSRSWKSMPCAGPYNFENAKRWLLDSRDAADTPLEDIGSPGDRYRVTFSWASKSVKELQWVRLDGRTGNYPKGTYHLSGSWTPDYVDMKPQGEGKFAATVKMTGQSIDFFIVRNKDDSQRIYPDVSLDSEGNAKAKGASGDAVLGVGPWPTDKVAPAWSVKGGIGDTINITFTRNPSLPDEMELEWVTE